MTFRAAFGKKVVTSLASFGLAFSGMPAHADYSCSVKITAILVYADGTVSVNHTGRNDYTNICNINQAWQSVSPNVCATWTATLNQIKRINGNATFYYSGTSNCAALPTYGNSIAPVYVGYTP